MTGGSLNEERKHSKMKTVNIKAIVAAAAAIAVIPLFAASGDGVAAASQTGVTNKLSKAERLRMTTGGIVLDRRAAKGRADARRARSSG